MQQLVVISLQAFVLVGLEGCAKKELVKEDPPEGEPTGAWGNASLTIDEAELPRVIADAEAGNTDAAFRLAKHYDFAVRDYKAARKWERVAAEHGHTVAAYNLGMSLLETDDLEKKREGIEWLKKAAAKGHKPAIYQLKQLESAPPKKSSTAAERRSGG